MGLTAPKMLHTMNIIVKMTSQMEQLYVFTPQNTTVMIQLAQGKVTSIPLSYPVIKVTIDVGST